MTGLKLCPATVDADPCLRDQMQRVHVIPACVKPATAAAMNASTADFQPALYAESMRSPWGIAGQNIFPPDLVPIVGTRKTEGHV